MWSERKKKCFCKHLWTNSNQKTSMWFWKEAHQTSNSHWSNLCKTTHSLSLISQLIKDVWPVSELTARLITGDFSRVLVPSAPLGAAGSHHHRSAAAAAGGSAWRGHRDAPGWSLQPAVPHGEIRVASAVSSLCTKYLHCLINSDLQLNPERLY